MNDQKPDYCLFNNRELLHHLKALALAHCAGRSRSEFLDGFLTGLAVVAALYGVERQFEAEAIKILQRQPKLIEAKQLAGKCGVAVATKDDIKNLPLHVQSKDSVKKECGAKK